MVKRLIFSLLVLGMVAACATAPAASPTIPAIAQVGVGYYSMPLTGSLARSYMQEQGPLPFDVVPGVSWPGAEVAAPVSAVMYVDFPPVPEGWFATPLGWEGIAVVVNQDVPLRSLNRKDLTEIYSGRVGDWSELGRGQGPIQPIIPPREEAFRRIFLDFVLPQGNVTTLARIAPTPAEALQLAAELDGAIAIVPASLNLQNSAVGIVRIEGTLPEQQAVQDGTYPLRSQIVAGSPKEAEGALRDWLIWVQASQIAE